jgi:hypothetical protein
MSDPKAQAQKTAEHTFVGFMNWTKWTVYGSLAFFLAVASCNFGVETGEGKTGSQYDGSVYDPQNLNGCKNFKCP